VVAHRVVTRAEIERGMPQDEIEAKFLACTERLYDPARQRRIMAAVAGFETAADLAALPALLTL
jgi:hypothetical protein